METTTTWKLINTTFYDTSAVDKAGDFGTES
jgi:hypothetical protein